MSVIETDNLPIQDESLSVKSQDTQVVSPSKDKVTVESTKSTFLPNGKIRHNDNGLLKELANAKLGISDGGNPGCCGSCGEDDLQSNVCSESVPKLEKDEQIGNDESSLCESVKEIAVDDPAETDNVKGIDYIVYESEKQMPDIMRLITKDLSEPYSIYTYRYFIHNWPKLCFLAMDKEKCVGAIVCKLDMHKKMVRRGYIAMLAVDASFRRNNIGSHLVLKAIKAMIADDCDEVVLETEITNEPALRLYERLGFVRDKRLFRYYLNGVDALRLKLWLR
ncbi:hypothetical protein FSP39_021850 [Pinctada imbricata]|uniref:N-terminal methionine N(alpha)-acetyltransferase NatC n=1 Tax=Pinctada imbricata TaxID=66713 RepID=A0AA88Y160_PINIB|nr:hypothetical protein FSP39_021850 [Pinctada imbricata]